MNGRIKLGRKRVAPTGIVPARPPEPWNDPDLAEELEVACLDAIRGDPPGQTVAGRLERTVRDVLTARGLSAVVQAKSDRRGTSVTILFHGAGATVQQVVLSLSG